MAKSGGKNKAKKADKGAKSVEAKKPRPARAWLRFALRTLVVVALGGVGLVVLYAFVNPPITPTIWAESRRLGGVKREWVAIENVSPAALRAIVAAEDARFCQHWGFDIAAIRAVVREGGGRGASTISQQTVKNVFLWQGRSWARKALEAMITPLVEAAWSKRRILEVYVNVAEFGEGIFGIEAAARHYFGVSAAELSARQAARLAAVLPSPKTRDPTNLSPALRDRAAQIESGADTIRADGRARCFDG
jgi:monofunctional biosynthetic peptidoglycan transglycosylase